MQRSYTAELRDQALRVLLISSIIYAASFPLAYAATKLYRGAGTSELGVHRFAMCFSNVGFMGFSVAESLLGRESLFIVSIYNIPFQILAFSVGVVMIAGKAGNRSSGKFGRAASLKVLLNPAIASALVGLVLFLGSISIPDPLYTAMELLGGMTTPLAIVVIGVAGVYGGDSVTASALVFMSTILSLATIPLISSICSCSSDGSQGSYKNSSTRVMIR
jgi:predicted permease